MSRVEIQKLTSRLVEIPSVSGDHEANLAALNVCSEFLGSDIEYVDFEKNGVVSRLWGSPETMMNPQLLLLGHVDVVGVDGDDSLFNPRIDGARMYARGAGDMKGHNAAMLASLKKRHEEDGLYGIGLLLTTDEEIGGFNGARHVVESGLTADVVFVPDGEYNFDIVKSQKAPHHFILQTKGVGGHASRAFKITNPLNQMFEFYQEARDMFALASKEDPWKSTFEMTVISTPNESKNKIPDEATAAFSWRWPLEQISFNEGRQEILSLCEKYGCEVLLEEGGGEGCLTDVDANFVQDWKEIVESEIRREISFVNTHGATDSRHFYNVQEFGSRKILLTSGVTGDHHGQGEWIDLDSLVQLSNALSRYMQLF